MRFYAFIGLTILLSTTAQSAPTKEQIEKWGVYATLADTGWWEVDGEANRFSWLEPGSRIMREDYFPDGKVAFTIIFNIEGSNFKHEDGYSKLITSKGPNHINFGPNNFVKIDEDGYAVEHYIIKDGDENIISYLPIPAPIFPDEKYKASMVGKVMCPTTRAALAEMLAPIDYETIENKGMMGYSYSRKYKASSFRLLGAKPNSVAVAIINDDLWGIEAMLPGYNPRLYEPLFRAAFPRGKVSCDEGGCQWEPSKNFDDLAEGALSGASTARTIFSETETRFLCNYK